MIFIELTHKNSKRRKLIQLSEIDIIGELSGGVAEVWRKLDDSEPFDPIIETYEEVVSMIAQAKGVQIISRKRTLGGLIWRTLYCSC